MQLRYEHPMRCDVSRLQEHCKLDMHVGNGWIEGVGAEGCLDVQIVYPPHGDCLILMAGQGNHVPSRGLGKNLEATGDSPHGSFTLRCPQFSVQSKSPSSEKIGWAVASPVNGVMKITYSPMERPTMVRALINNFDFSWGDVSSDSLQSPMESERLTVEADGRPVVFERRGGYAALKRLVETEIGDVLRF